MGEVACEQRQAAFGFVGKRLGLFGGELDPVSSRVDLGLIVEVDVIVGDIAVGSSPFDEEGGQLLQKIEIHTSILLHLNFSIHTRKTTSSSHLCFT